MLAILLIFVAALVIARYGVLTPQGRLLIEARSSGLKLGRFGRLKVEGLGGDIWREFTVRRLTLADEKGVWLEADALDVRWSYGALLERRLRVDAATAGLVKVVRRPVLTPKGPPSRGLPINFDIASLKFRLQTLPAFSVTPGLFDVAASLRLKRHGGASGGVKALSLLHAGDFVQLKFNLGRKHPLLIQAKALEAQGGAFAGALGLPAKQPFSIDARAAGAADGSGRVDLDLHTGERTPVQAHGGWTTDGGVIAGAVSLEASSLTQPFARMFGRTAAVAVAARRASGGLYGVAVQVRAPNLGLVAQGPADLKAQRSTAGLKTAVVVNDLSRFVAQPRMGAARAQGVLTGGPGDWRFVGAGGVEGVEASGYRLARAAGPLAVAGKGKEVSVEAAFTGAGGEGGGPAGAWLGPAPRGDVELTRLADGRILIRKADATGQGLKLAASGSRGLFGDLNLKGQVELSGLERIRPGAAGAFQASWTATQAAPSKPWMLSADGKGHGFASSLPELDRLLGPEPRVRLQAALIQGVLAISSSSLDGAKASATAQGRVDPKGPLALQTTWRADGPFQAGPVTISGKASGQGAVTGTLANPRADLDADFAVIDAPRLPLKATHVHLTFLKGPAGFTGQVAMTGQSSYGAARAKSDFRFAPGGIDLSGIDADAAGVRATGALSLRGSAPSTADLQLSIGPGLLLTRGEVSGTVRITDGRPASATVALQAVNAALRDSPLVIRSGKLAGSGPLGRLPFQLTADTETPQGPLTLNVNGVYQQAGAAQEVALTGSGKFRLVEFRTVEPIAVRRDGKDLTARLRLAMGDGRLDLDLKQAQGAASAVGAVRGVDLKALGPDFVGHVDADINLQGSGPRLAGTVTAQLDDARSVDSPKSVAVDAAIKAVLRGDRLDVDAQATGGGGMRSSASVEFPVVSSASPLQLAIVRNKPISGRFSAEGEVQPLWNLVYGSERQLAGQVKLQGTIAGTLADPLLTGDAAVAGGKFQDFSTGLVLTNLTLDADLQRDMIELKTLTAKDEKSGEISGSGVVSLERGGGSSLKLDFKRFRLIDNDTAEATATGRVTVTRAADGKVKIDGDLGLDRAQINAEARLRPSVATIDVVERNVPETTKAQLKPEAARGPPIALDVRLKASRGVIVKGRGVDLELSLDAHVTGSMAKPALSGTARVVRGDYDFAGKRFQFDDTGMVQLGDTPEQIRLDLTATWEAPSLSATVRIKGTAAKPEITLSSTPSLPQEEILAQVLFGSSASQLSRAETAQLASTVTALATGGGFDVLGSLRQFAGLDRLALGGDDTSGMTVAGGKYIGRDVYLELIGGGREGPTAEVDWRVRKGLSLVSQIGGQLGAKLSVRWSHDVGQPPRQQGSTGP